MYTKDAAKIFDAIDQDVYDAQYAKLLELRAKHIHLRDDTLLMYMLCEHFQSHKERLRKA